ncbi:molybdopterin-binding protein [Granulicella tundricola]|uniref:Oxidoreductase molybdopterin-binding domain-containing protein n=1 Tax=Granulicella tundricola (strain ATCC BAA-1859 / DSM 23138 / MP5ACTX9) TaxID=1198114 RepID=E8WW82_GRATM|nr:hypothetical protein [Granulicella tundricola]ADW68465.1 hypothetical protein AciX9_1407 [Granulicella tundricola MP5ACTX9]
MRNKLAGAVLGLTLGVFAGASAQTAAPAAETHIHKPSAPSTSLTLTVDGKTVKLTPDELAAMPQRTITAHNGHSKVDEVYMGVAVSDLLAKQGVTMAGDGAKKVYRSYLRATGTDKYWVLFAASEVEGEMHQGDVIIALTVDGKPLTEDGKFKLVSTEDKRPARWVRNLESLVFVTVE